MSNAANKLIQAAAGNAGEAVYVDDVFSTYLYAGNGTSQSIVNGIDVSGEGGLVWIKCRSNNHSNLLFDTERGATKYLESNGTNAETTDNTNTLSAFNNNGFTVIGDSPANQGDHTFCSWTFRKQEGFFDVVTYTGDGATSRDINHNLGSAPGAIIIKRTDNTSDWTFQHRYEGNYALYLNSDAARSDSGATFQFNSTNFKVVGPPSGLADAKCTNVNGATYVAYLFAHDEQEFGTDSDEAIIKCGSFSGAGQVDLGFEPQWILYKPYSQSWDWEIADNMRGLDAASSSVRKLEPNTSDAEANGSDIKINATGFYNGTFGSSYPCIYVAIRRPHKPAEEFAATDLLKVAPRSNTSGADYAFVSNFPVDMGMARNVLASTEMRIGARLTKNQYLETPTADAEATVSDWGGWDSMNSVSLGFSKSAESPVEKYGWMFRRAPGFFDVVCYTGSGSAGTMTINHNLGVVPEMMWVKNRTASYNWWAAHTFTASNAVKQYPALNGAQAGSTESYGTSLGLNAQPTSTSFVVNTDTMIGRNQDWVAYLFATVAGISKVGTYTGTTNDVNVDCGFSSGARFVLVKRTDGVGDWYLWDSERGIVAGNDPYILLSTTGAQDSSEDFIDPLSSGFTITSNASTPLNANNGTYLFYAVA